MINRLNSSAAGFDAALQQLLHRTDESGHQAAIQQTVAEIIAEVRRNGDRAVFEYTRRFDDFDPSVMGLEIPVSQLQAALESIAPEQRSALQYAAQRVRDYHQHQVQESWSYTETDGTELGQKITPLSRVGLYVPGGKAAYPSSVLMNAIPAKVAGVAELIMVTPTLSGLVNELVLAAAHIAGVDRVFRVGGAQAIAALAYGTESLPRVDKITGPGNAYVAAAKQQVFGQVGIDMIAGPSEVLIIADSSCDPDWVAMDLFAQAEHDELAQSLLLTTDEDFAAAVNQSIQALLPTMERRAIIRAALQANGAIIVVQSRAELIEYCDLIAPEHLEIFTADADLLAAEINNAGAIFIGPYSAESLGDYCAGPNHVLPTSGTARFSSPLGVYDFQKRSSVIKISRRGAQSIGQQASILARGEALTAHARSAEYRLESPRKAD